MFGAAAALTLGLGDGGFLVSSSVIEDKQAHPVPEDHGHDVKLRCDEKYWDSAARGEIGAELVE